MPATKKRTGKKALIGRNPIVEREVERAAKLAQRKSGVTKRQLAERLKCTEARAATVLSRVKGVKSSAKGAGAGKACRTLVYTKKK